ncbi:MAG: M48 family metallopeptidase [FCB group bacterium]|nr:M48 family metallopeptidase [FCB group bacterium]
MTVRIVELDGIGQVMIEQSPRAKYLRLSVRATTGVRVTVPRGMKLADGERLVYKKAAWIRRKLTELNAARQRLGPELDSTETNAIIQRQVQTFARKYGFSYRKLTVRTMTSRWGSCSTTNSLSINARVTGLPDELRDYIIIHELAHTEIKNHGPRFWARMDQIYGPGKARELNRQLRLYSPVPPSNPDRKSASRDSGVDLQSTPG